MVRHSNAASLLDASKTQPWHTQWAGPLRGGDSFAYETHSADAATSRGALCSAQRYGQGEAGDHQGHNLESVSAQRHALTEGYQPDSTFRPRTHLDDASYTPKELQHQGW